MDYIYENTTDHERAQTSRAGIKMAPNDEMVIEDIYEEMW